MIEVRKERPLNLTRGRMYVEGLTVEGDYEKGDSFSHRAIQCGITEAFVYLAEQYDGGLGIPHSTTLRHFVLPRINLLPLPSSHIKFIYICVLIAHLPLGGRFLHLHQPRRDHVLICDNRRRRYWSMQHRFDCIDFPMETLRQRRMAEDWRMNLTCL